MLDKVLKTIHENSMFSVNDKVIVAVSGGPDSMCLLHVLNRIKDKLNIKIIAAHVNHCLRGNESDEDEVYVKEFCSKLNIDFYSTRVDINRFSKEKGLSSEMAGRAARYEFFENIKSKVGAQKIAIAHNANDQAETILMRIMRGTGIAGIVGIKPVRDKIFVRPLIKIGREEIESYCKKEHINPRIDNTNLTNIYSRNKVRLELIPYIKRNFNEDIITTLNRLSDTVNVDNDYLEYISSQKYKLFCDEKKDEIIIHKEAFLEHKAIIARIIRKSICYLLNNTYNFEKKHILDIINLQLHKTGTNLDLPKNIKVYNNYGDISIYFKNEKIINKDNNEYELFTGKNIIQSKKIIITIKTLSKNNRVNFKENNFIKYFDYYKIKDKIILRYRKKGDKFIPIGMSGNKKLKDMFIDMKIEKSLRDKIPLICFGSEIAWIVGYRVSDKFKVDENTIKILEIKFESEANNDRRY
ncbi:tRNA(Ile)-lysidine synthase [Clostridium pasteurianum DSM 525 = ATCC 6013]|uniref:tRNA(Ile)-lysidine synthase n=1 Tax=Clostridium pasteurianum DSM 525 = ATCC 6013 TaxID=1262449 RepID=A0A0H3JAR4_CLOPA|nr:tRNA lysidine(34) synthetase TilS [Clostridium pasteurianum]AJA49773.1 tRNA(Ile)-lysidine synthase [Clostridium pasteurianum DSM 525 = ATCC 6013]AJA53761.1 tRNA(Ile)-lysidine synthase [Clostridium pasteurianum DSM 525 = ATCC 6013]AOZ76924.1 tRNA(Ile)-lysidine synthetase [Clostridium pasteurianum DSM 525 = ATCC 6013]AOZ80721.1 tRNA(Ile)-lysidine synthetase [Clostridium pasteurianum]ELP57720.1 cell cycle protein MesJ [Clostridium pasteurianum DSM 525 = ATCC 6013]